VFITPLLLKLRKVTFKASMRCAPAQAAGERESCPWQQGTVTSQLRAHSGPGCLEVPSCPYSPACKNQGDEHPRAREEPALAQKLSYEAV